MFYGVTTATSGIDVSSFASSNSNSNGAVDADIAGPDADGLVWASITAGAGQYILFAWPARLADPTFWVGGQQGGFTKQAAANYTNPNGYLESYNFFTSNQANLGATVVTTKPS